MCSDHAYKKSTVWLKVGHVGVGVLRILTVAAAIFLAEQQFLRDFYRPAETVIQFVSSQTPLLSVTIGVLFILRTTRLRYSASFRASWGCYYPSTLIVHQQDWSLIREYIESRSCGLLLVALKAREQDREVCAIRICKDLG